MEPMWGHGEYILMEFIERLYTFSAKKVPILNIKLNGKSQLDHRRQPSARFTLTTRGKIILLMVSPTRWPTWLDSRSEPTTVQRPSLQVSYSFADGEYFFWMDIDSERVKSL